MVDSDQRVEMKWDLGKEPDTSIRSEITDDTLTISRLTDEGSIVIGTMPLGTGEEMTIEFMRAAIESLPAVRVKPPKWMEERKI